MLLIYKCKEFKNNDLTIDTWAKGKIFPLLLSHQVCLGV